MATFTDMEAIQIEQTAADVNHNIAEIRRLITTLGDVIPTLTPVWEGEARNLFFRQFGEYINSLQALVAEHETLNSRLQENARTYRTANDRILSTLNTMPLA